jgi:hypothetical protein
MVNINIDGDYKLVSDTYGWILKTKKIVGEKRKNGEETKPENIGKERWNDVGYYSTLNNLFNAYTSIKARQSDATSFQELMDVIKEIQTIIDKISTELGIK